MSPEAVSGLPLFWQVVVSAGVFLGLAAGAFWKYVKTGGDTEKKGNEAQIVGGAIFDNVSMRSLRDQLVTNCAMHERLCAVLDRLIGRLDQVERTVDDLDRTIRDEERTHCQCVKENTAALKLLSDSMKGLS